MKMETFKRPPSIGMRHIALKVDDIVKAEDFYVRVLGFHVEWRPDAKNLYLSSGPDNLALHENKQKGSREGGSLDHFGILVQKPEHVDQWALYLKSQSIPLAQEPKTHRDGARSLYFKDPDGNLIQLLHHPTILF